MARDFDVVVVGAGIEGLATANYLQRNGTKTLLLEQFPFPHNRGSSAGITRITRLSYDRPEYGALMPDAFRMWDALEKETKMTLYRQTGCLFLGPKDGEKVKSYERSMIENGFNYTKYSSDELRIKYPQIKCPSNYTGINDSSGGLLYANKCLLAYMASFLKNGGTFHDAEAMTKLHTESNGVCVETAINKYRCNRVVLTMGPWAPAFLKDNLNLNFPQEPQKTICCYWKEKNMGEHSADNGFPTVMAYNNGTFYMKPSLEYPGLVQFGIHIGWKADPDNRDKTDVTEKYLDTVRTFGRDFFPNIDFSKPSIQDTCMYTENTGDKGFILDVHPENARIVIGTGFTGHGFKMAPVVGTILGDFALGKARADMRFDPSHFRISRFNNIKSNL